MKAILTSAICSSLLLISGCNSQVNNNDVNSAVSTQKTALASGIEKANIDNSVRAQDNFYR